MVLLKLVSRPKIKITSMRSIDNAMQCHLRLHTSIYIGGEREAQLIKWLWVNCSILLLVPYPVIITVILSISKCHATGILAILTRTGHEYIANDV